MTFRAKLGTPLLLNWCFSKSFSSFLIKSLKIKTSGKNAEIQRANEESIGE